MESSAKAFTVKKEEELLARSPSLLSFGVCVHLVALHAEAGSKEGREEGKRSRENGL